MKNKLRKMLSLVLAVVIAMSAISVNTLAATRMNIANSSNQKLYVDWYGYSYNFNGRLNTSTYGQIIKRNVGSSTGQVAYCIQSSKDAWTGDYTAQDYYDDLSRAQKLNLKHALIYGYQGTTNYGYNADTERIATQMSSGISVTVGSTTLPKARLSVYSPRVCQALWLQMSRLAITRSKSRC